MSDNEEMGRTGAVVESEPGRSRKRKRCPEAWKRTIEKRAR